MEFFRVTNFDQLQHYKDRSPPWIKLYNDLMDDYNFACLQDASKLHLIMIFLLASRANNQIPCDTRWISSRINATEEVDLEALFESGYIEKIPAKTKTTKPKRVASKPLAESEQDACLEKSREEGEKRLEKINKKFGLDFSPWPELPEDQTLEDWFAMRKRTKANVSQTVINRFATELAKAINAGWSADFCLQECVTRNWRGFEFGWLNKPGGRNGQANGPAPQGRPSGNSAAERNEAAIDAAFGGSPGILEGSFERVDEASPVDRGYTGNG